MAKRRVAEFLLKLINLLLTISGLAILIYGIVLLIRWKRASSASSYSSSLGAGRNSGLLNKEQLVARRLFAAVHFSKSISDRLPAAWFIHLLIAIGATLFIISCFGYIGAAARNRCCLSVYSAFIVILVTVEVGFTAFILFDRDWKEEIPADRTGNFLAIDNFSNTHWKVIKWIALGGVILEAIVFVLALYLVIAGWTATANYDSDGYIVRPFQRPLTARRTVPVTARRTVPVTARRTVPVAAQRTVPVIAQRTVPVTAQRTVPVAAQRTVPVIAQRTVPMTAQRTVPVTGISVANKCTT